MPLNNDIMLQETPETLAALSPPDVKRGRWRWRAVLLVPFIGFVALAAGGLPGIRYADGLDPASLPAASFDAVVSRFGVMFFVDPTRAFTRHASDSRKAAR